MVLNEESYFLLQEFHPPRIVGDDNHRLFQPIS
jgi:hypothetical protein